MTFRDFLKNCDKATINAMYGRFATCSPDPCRAEWYLNVDDVTQLASVFGVTRLFKSIDTYYNGNVVNEVYAAVMVHGYLKQFSALKVTLDGDHSTLAKDLYVLKKEIEEDGFIVHALKWVMHTVLDEKLDFCVVAIIFMDLLRCKED